MEKFKQLKETLGIFSTRLDNHGDRLDILEQRGASVDVRIENLCQQLQDLTHTLKWFIGLMVGSFVAFFFYVIQQSIF